MYLYLHKIINDKTRDEGVLIIWRLDCIKKYVFYEKIYFKHIFIMFTYFWIVKTVKNLESLIKMSHGLM